MRKTLLLICIFSLATAFVQTASAATGTPRNQVDNFFHKAKFGDAKGFEAMLTDPLLSKFRKLIDDNKEYKNMMRDRYRNAELEVNSIQDSPGAAKIADVTVHYANGDRSTHKFILQEVSPGEWKISDEIFK